MAENSQRYPSHMPQLRHMTVRPDALTKKRHYERKEKKRESRWSFFGFEEKKEAPATPAELNVTTDRLSAFLVLLEDVGATPNRRARIGRLDALRQAMQMGIADINAGKFREFSTRSEVRGRSAGLTEEAVSAS